MNKYEINFTFGSDSINDVFSKVLFREIKDILKKFKNGVSLSCTYIALNEGGNDYTFREYE